MQKTRKVEFLRALDDHTWDTVVLDVPESQIADGSYKERCEAKLLRENSAVVLVGVYYIEPDTEEGY